MKELRKCDNCEKTVRDLEAIGWWEAKRIYPIYVNELPDDYDFCSYDCLEQWITERREANK